MPKSRRLCVLRVLRVGHWGRTLKMAFFREILMNIDLVCQSTPKDPLWTRVSRGAVATVITACGFVTDSANDCERFGVATVITACGFVTQFIKVIL